MLTAFIAKKLQHARYKLLKDGSYFGEVAGMSGVWANANTLEDCRKELQEVLEDWLVLKIRSHESVSGFAPKVGQRMRAR